MSSELDELVEEEVLTPTTLGGLQLETVVEAVQYVNILIFGDPGVGKTVLCGSASVVPSLAPVLVVDVEGGTLSLAQRYPDVKRIRVKSMQELQAVYDELFRGTSFKTIVIDSITELQKFSMEQIMRQVIKEHPDRDPDIASMREWGKNIEQTRRVVRAFRDLPYNTIITALSMQDQDNKGNKRQKPSLSGKLSNEVAGFFDIVGYLNVKTVDGERHRLLQTTQTDSVVAKDRTGQLPAVIVDPDMGSIVAPIFGASNN